MNKKTAVAIGAIFGALIGLALGLIIISALAGGLTSIPLAITLACMSGKLIGGVIAVTTASSALTALSGFFYSRSNQKQLEAARNRSKPLQTAYSCFDNSMAFSAKSRPPQA